jgi:hypothetical protein
MESDRAKFITPTTIEAFFEKLEALFETGRYTSNMIANFDETMIKASSQTVSVVGPSSAHGAYITKNPEMPHITLGVTVFADGSQMRNLVIYPLKSLPSEITEDFLRTHHNIAICGQSNGWITAEILEGYMLEHVLEEFLARKLQSGSSDRGLLLLDGHASRNIPNVWKTFADNDIDVLTFVSHSTHILQPLDLCVFGALKRFMAKDNSSLNKLSASQRRGELMKKALESLYHAACPANIISGFQRAGVYPLDKLQPLGHSAINRDPATPSIPIRKRKSVISLTGDILTSASTIQRMVENRTELLQRTARRGMKRGRSAKKTSRTPLYEEDTDTLSEESSEEE